jgi:hypothetical protein
MLRCLTQSVRVPLFQSCKAPNFKALVIQQTAHFEAVKHVGEFGLSANLYLSLSIAAINDCYCLRSHGGLLVRIDVGWYLVWLVGGYDCRRCSLFVVCCGGRCSFVSGGEKSGMSSCTSPTLEK